MSWYIYIAKASTGRYYVGMKQDPLKRMHDHNTHSGSRFGKQQGPFEMVYSSKAMATKSEARLRELQVKGWAREKKEKLISGELGVKFPPAPPKHKHYCKVLIFCA